MSRATGDEHEVAAFLRGRVDRGLRHISYFVVPSAAALLVLGEAISAVVFEHRKFTAQDSLFAWGILAGSSVGLLATTMGRLYSSTYYALHDTKTPLRFASVRIMLTLLLGYLCAIPLPKALGIDPRWGAAGLTASAGIAGWVEFVLLRRTMNARIGRTGLPAAYVVKLWTAAISGAAVAWAVKLTLPALPPVVAAALIIGPYGVVFLAMTVALRIEGATAMLRSIVRRA
jgi:putative peptidoglycan lipid II flippase